MDKVNLAEKMALFTERWKPKIVGELNDCYVKVVKFQGEFVWHTHPEEDELFLVVSGSFELRYRDRVVTLKPGELAIVPKGIEHCPFAALECHVMLIERKTTVNTGDAGGARTVEKLERI